MNSFRRMYYKFKYRKTYGEAIKRNKERIDKLVTSIIEDGNPYRIWGEIIPAVYLTEWEIRYIAGCTSDNSEYIKRWLEEKLIAMEQDMV